MSIIINGTTIPTTAGSIKVGNTNITKVNVVSGGTTTTVWQSTNAYYAYQNGAAVNGISNPTITSNVANSGSCTTSITTYSGGIGVYATSIKSPSSSSNGGPKIRMRTPSLPVNGNTTCTIDLFYNYTSGDGVLSVYYYVYGISSSGAETLLKSGYSGDGGTGSFTLTVSSYSSIIIEGYIAAGDGLNGDRSAWVTIKNCYFS